MARLALAPVEQSVVQRQDSKQDLVELWRRRLVGSEHVDVVSWPRSGFLAHTDRDRGHIFLLIVLLPVHMARGINHVMSG
jgi:hypothetical protein